MVAAIRSGACLWQIVEMKLTRLAAEWDARDQREWKPGLAAKTLLSCPLRGGARLNLSGLRIASRKGAWMTGGGS